MNLNEEELKLLEAAVAAWKLNRRSAAEEEEICSRLVAPAYRAWCDAGHPPRGPMKDTLRKYESKAARIRFRSHEFWFHYAESMNRLLALLSPRVSEGDLPPVSDAPLRKPDANSRERDAGGNILPPAWRVGECGEGESK
jgi:hypothetical protein